jgi:hypothetical protein
MISFDVPCDFKRKKDPIATLTKADRGGGGKTFKLDESGYLRSQAQTVTAL